MVALIGKEIQRFAEQRQCLPLVAHVMADVAQVLEHARSAVANSVCTQQFERARVALLRRGIVHFGAGDVAKSVQRLRGEPGITNLQPECEAFLEPTVGFRVIAPAMRKNSTAV